MSMITMTTVLQALTRHVGSERGVTADQLACEVLGQRPEPSDLRRLRDCVSELRESGVAVCARPETGYFIAETAEELDESCQFLRSRAMHSLSIEAKLRKITLPDLLGQLRLPT